MISKSKLGLVEMIFAMIIMGTVGYFVVETEKKAHNVVFFHDDWSFHIEREFPLIK